MRVCCWAFHLVIARVARWGELGEESKRTNVRKDADIKATATNFGSDLNRAEIPEEELTQAISNIKQLIQELKIGRSTDHRIDLCGSLEPLRIVARAEFVECYLGLRSRPGIQMFERI